MKAEEFIGMFLTPIILFGANCGGLGGAGALIPVCLFFFNFDTKSSIAISNATVCVAGIMRLFINWRKNHPLKIDTKGKPFGVLVDYNIATLMLPMTIVGAAGGVAVNALLPEVLIVILLVILLAYITITTGIKLCQIRKEEAINPITPAENPKDSASGEVEATAIGACQFKNQIDSFDRT